ncbi:HEAT repeat-containing protein [Rivularia sp. PCC 7116]|uniref:sister chromatid cohesion protein PDS5 n=1 Tax=Rivularia sp. PCC 7116 TaxID=373994 RepID=UPI00029F3F7F|nr:sister chromatid cohesion protein PDS5 [Rivularia sp. PCC 7116]AFY52768.1 HEAT repeat-containing protein [Rivularia sp. PCC 7116]
MNNSINIFFKFIQVSAISLGLSLTSINQASGALIEDSKLEKYANIRKRIETNKKVGVILRQTTPEAVNKLIEKLQSKDAEIRGGAASILGEVNQQQELVISALIKALQDENPIIRANAASSLGELLPFSESSESIITALTQALQDKNSLVRSKAISALKESTSILRGTKSISDQELLVPKLIRALQDKNPVVRANAASYLKEIVPSHKLLMASDIEARIFSRILLSLEKELPILTESLEDDSSEVRSSIAKVLEVMGEKAASAVPQLTETLKDDNSQVRISVAFALGKMKTKAASAVPQLAKTLKDDNSKVRSTTAWALGNIGEKSISAVPQLIQALEDDSSEVRSSTVFALKMIAEGYRNQVEKLSNKELEAGINNIEKAVKALDKITSADLKVTEKVFNKFKLSVQRTLTTLKKEKDSRLTSRIFEWMVKHPWFAATIIYLIFFPLLWSSLLLIRPLWLLKLNQKLQPLSNLQLPEALGGWTISIPGIIFLQPFTYHPRVLDAWVATNIKVARDNFSVKKTVSNRAEHISLPVVVDKKTIANFSGNDLKASFDKKLTNILIHAEGGSGKTSLACQLAKWGMSDDINIRPSKHRMLPILIEQELDVDAEGNQAFIQEICGQLQVLIGESEVIPTKLVENLLRQRRILVIIDHFSEMSFSTRKQIRPASPNFPANALIVNSRLEESLDNVPKTTLKPLRVSGNQLSSFMEAYLTQRGKRDLFDDAEYFDACRRLSLMVGKRNITALFAKLYAERMIAKVAVDSDDFVDDLPLSIPDLMLGYINELNRETAEGELDNRTLQKDAKTIAWECLKKTFRPGSTKLDDVVAVLDNQDSVNARLHHLEKRLRIIQISEPGRDKVRFALDPLAEYLAALYLVDSYGQDKDKWMEFINAAKSVNDLEAIQGFLLAVQDCCVSNPEDVSDFIVASLSELTGVVLTPSQESLITHGF